MTGNAYSFLHLYSSPLIQIAEPALSAVAGAKSLYRACCFEEFSAREDVPFAPDKFYLSLFEGLAGVECFDVDLLQPERPSFPRYPF